MNLTFEFHLNYVLNGTNYQTIFIKSIVFVLSNAIFDTLYQAKKKGLGELWSETASSFK
jgi:hypothetical protein